LGACRSHPRIGMIYGKYFFHKAELSKRIPDAVKSCRASGKGYWTAYKIIGVIKDAIYGR